MAMEQGTPSSSGLYGEGEERGTGGKFRKPPARRRPQTPYDRPRSNQSQASGQRLDGGWLSKIVDPACRLIAGGATRIFPSIFSKSPFSAALTTEDYDSGVSEEEETACDGSEGCNLNLEISKPGGSNSKEGAEIENGSFDCGLLGKDKISNLPDGSEFSKIEQLVKGRIFSRDELNRLTEILNSRVGGLSNVNSEEKKQNMSFERKGKKAVLAREDSRMSIEEKQEGLDGRRVGTPTPLLPLAAKEAVGASPVDIARAYMRTRVSEVDTASGRIIYEAETSLPQSDGYASPLMPSSSPKSSVCWPGAMVQDQHGYSTPQSSGYGLHHFQRTPYSRSIYSKSKPELVHSQAHKKRYLNILSPPRLQPQTTLFGKDNTLNNANGSMGPIRRIRRTFVSEARPRGSDSVHFPQNGPLQSGNSSISKGLLLATKKNLEVGSTSTHTDFQRVENTRNTFEVGIPALQSSNPAVRAILEHLDRNKPTPKEKSAELQLATQWKKSSSSNITETLLKGGARLPQLEVFDFHKNRSNVEKGCVAQEKDRENSKFKVTPAERSTSEVADGGNDIGTSSTLNGSSGSQIKCDNETTSCKVDGIEQKGMNQLWPFHNQSERQEISSTVPNFCSSELQKKPPFHPSRTKPNLPSISVGKPSFGFTFPVSTSSGNLPEPPTPSLIPSTLAGGSPPQPKDGPAIPSYSFGTNRSSPPLVFSFPSTSNASAQDNDMADIKFSFGSDSKPRVVLKSVERDSICY